MTGKVANAFKRLVPAASTPMGPRLPGHERVFRAFVAAFLSLASTAKMTTKDRGEGMLSQDGRGVANAAYSRTRADRFHDVNSQTIPAFPGHVLGGEARARRKGVIAPGLYAFPGGGRTTICIRMVPATSRLAALTTGGLCLAAPSRCRLAKACGLPLALRAECACGGTPQR